MSGKRRSAFDEQGFKRTLEELIAEVQEIYLADDIPWVVGYSGGKDSTATLQLVWRALRDLPAERRQKRVHVISTDTLVENPIVSAWVSSSIDRMKQAASDQGLPVTAHKLTPEIGDTFWVNLIGRGYPSPRPKFRWCTERMKIKPSNKFIGDMVRSNGEAILVLGTRKAESSKRHANMKKYEQQRERRRLSPNAKLPNCLIFSPVEEWTNDDVWTFLMQTDNPWGHNNKELLGMYQGASEDGECPLVVDDSTPSCGDSRFGCWVCTMVDEDKSMSAMIHNDDEKEWMLPLLELRNELAASGEEGDRAKRDFRRLTGHVQLHRDRLVHGPYLQSVRADWLRKVLEAQRWVRENGPQDVQALELISLAELHEIRRIWVIDKHEIEDSLPRIYEEMTGEEFPGAKLDDNLVFGQAEIELLREVCGNDRVHFELTRSLLDVERQFRTKTRRAGLFDALEKEVRRGFYEDEDDALGRLMERRGVVVGDDVSETAPVRQLPLIQDDGGEANA